MERIYKHSWIDVRPNNKKPIRYKGRDQYKQKIKINFEQPQDQAKGSVYWIY